MSIRPATATDHHPDIPWLHADDPGRGVRILVDEHDGHIRAAARRGPNRLHPGIDFLELANPDQGSPDLLSELRALAVNPLVMRGLPGTPAHQLAITAGAYPTERIPASCMDTTDPAIRAWAQQHQAPTRPASEITADELLDLWVPHWQRVEAPLGGTQDTALIRSAFQPLFTAALDRDLSCIVEEAGQPVALALAFHDGDSILGNVDAVVPDHPSARSAVAAAMSALLLRAPVRRIEFDGHESGPHYPAVLRTIPHITDGPLTPMELLRLDAPSRATPTPRPEPAAPRHDQCPHAE